MVRNWCKITLMLVAKKIFYVCKKIFVIFSEMFFLCVRKKLCFEKVSQGVAQ